MTRSAWRHSRAPLASIAAVALIAGCSTAAPTPTAPPAAAPKPTTAAPAAASPAASPAAAAASPAASAVASPAAKPAASPSAAASLVPSPSPAAAAAAPASSSLKGICPDTIVFQTNWWPEPDHGLFYQLIGPNGTIDTNKNTYSGPLGTTGVNVEIRAGGPAIGFQTVTAQEYQDDSIMLGMMGTDEQIGSSANQPTRAVVASSAKSRT